MKSTKIVSSVLMAGLIAMPVFGVSEDPLQQFKLASLAYQNGRYDSAEQEFQAFLSYHAKHKLAAQAQFALGEIKFAQKKYPEAADHFMAVIKKYGGTYEA